MTPPNSPGRRCLLAAITVSTLVIAPATFARSVYVLTATNEITTVEDAAPGAPGPLLPVSGLVAGDALVAIDVRPQNNHLYGLGYNGGTASVRLYLIESRSGAAVATSLGEAGSYVDAGGAPLPIIGSAINIDFNPTVDRLRVVTDTGQSFRMNPNNGALVDGDFGGAAGSVTGVNPDGSANGAATTFNAASYANNRANVSATTLYVADAGTDALYIVNPPNAGTLTNPLPLTLDGNPLDIEAQTGFDIPSSVNVAANASPATGVAYAAFSVGGESGLYQVELSTGATTLVGTFGGLAVRSIAVSDLAIAAQSLNATGTSLQRFLAASPSASINVNITGVSATERLVGFDLRPATGQWFALGVDALANAASLYRIDPQTGAATLIGANAGQIAFVDALGAPVDMTDGTYGVSFNPVVDRVRVVASNGLNFRAHPITGGAVDGDLGGASGSIPGTNTDGPVTGAVGSTGLDGAAYSSNVAGTTVTTLFTLDATGDRLYIQNPPNVGVQTAPVDVTFNGAPVDFAPTTGFDIPPGPAAAANNAPVDGSGFAALTVSDGTRLYRLGLISGALEDLGPIGDGTVPSIGLVIGDVLDDVIFADGFD